MKKYFTLTKSIDWKNIITSVKPEIYSLLDSNNGSFVFAWNNETELIQVKFDSYKLKLFESKNKTKYIFGYVGYDAKNSYYKFNKSNKSNKGNYNNLPESILFIPEHTIINKNGHYLYYGLEENVNTLLKFENLNSHIHKKTKVLPQIYCATEKVKYLKNVNSIKKLIQNGDIYELNYCINFHNSNCELDIINTFLNLKEKTKAPFSGIFKYHESHIVSASPERFFNKHGNNLMSQPIKGTAARGNNAAKDELIKSNLKNDTKELAENIMIVDLVRNDFSRFSNKNSVKVTELCELYSFKNVHQLISTVESKIDHKVTFQDILNNTFPMGSMTGAPKLNAIQFIDKYEDFSRNCYSGSLGFISPSNNMDFNVVIRSIIYNSNSKKISIGVGGAITNKSVPLKEYIECILKLNSIRDSIRIH